ncbi:MAG: methyl-accepting chemotaxis protein, partial [Treponema sp.]|nr:methyl-accepting chemotaxis protein [Treponema sp.]
MKLRYRLSIIVIAILIAVVGLMSFILLNRASSMQMETALESQERLAAEQARIIQIWYEEYLQTIRTLADAMADYDKTEAGRQRNRFDQYMESILQSEERLIAVFVVFKPDNIDPGMDAAFAGTPGSTETGQWANWYTRRSGEIEHLTYDDVATVMHNISGEDARKELIYDPVPQTVAGENTYTVKLTVPVIHRKTGEVVGRVGVNINTAYTQPVVDDTIKGHPDITAMTVYSNNATIIASYALEQVGKLLKDAQSSLFSADTNSVQDAVLKGVKYRLAEYEEDLKTDLEMIIYPFTIGETGTNWALMLGTEKTIILEEVSDMTVFTVILAVAAVILTAVIIFFVAVSITKPIVNVALTLKDISEGEGDLTKTVALNSRDELGDLARYFNATLEKIKALVVTIKKQSVSLFDIGNELASNMTETAAAINEITANIQSIKSRV